MAEGRAVPTSDLLDALWPTELPDSARATLQSHVSRLRRHLGPAAPLLEGLSGAYRLRLDEAGSGTDVAQRPFAARSRQEPRMRPTPFDCSARPGRCGVARRSPSSTTSGRWRRGQ